MLKTVGDAIWYVNLQKCVIRVFVIHVLACIAGAYDVQADLEKVIDFKKWSLDM